MENENLILEYLQGNLPIEEQKAFQKRLDDEPTLMQEYLSLKPMYSYLIEKKARPEYTAELDRLGDKYFLPKEKKTKSNKLKLLIIALVALLAVFTLYHLINKTNQSLYESHADHFALHLVQKSSANEFALDAENAFNSQKYEKAKNALEQYLVKNHMDTKAKLALSICLLELEQYEQSVFYLNEIENGGSTLKNQATWYKALYFIKIDQFENAEKTLNKIQKNDKQLYAKALNLLKDIARIKESKK